MTKPYREGRDERHWEAIEEASELVAEGDLEAGLAELKRAIEKDPNNPYAYNLLGNTLFELKQLEPARDAFHAAVLVSPDFLGARVSLAHVHHALRNFEEAERQARIALERFPKDGDARHALGMALAARGKRGEARKNLEGFLASNPELEAATEVRSILEMLGLGEEGDPFEVEND